MPHARALKVAIGAAAVTITVAGCGSDPTTALAPATTPAPSGAALTPSPVTTGATTPASPNKQAKLLIKAAYGPRIDRHVADLARQWGSAPRAHWTTKQEASARYLTRLTLAGDASSQHLTATWRVSAQLDQPLTASQLQPATAVKAITATDAGARTLTSKSATTAVLGSLYALEGVGAALDGQTIVLAANTTLPDDAPEASRRAVALVQASGGRRVGVTLASSTRVIGPNGQPISASQLLATVRARKLPLLSVTWKTSSHPDSLAALEAAPPTIVAELADVNGAALGANRSAAR